MLWFVKALEVEEGAASRLDSSNTRVRIAAVLHMTPRPVHPSAITTIDADVLDVLSARMEGRFPAGDGAVSPDGRLAVMREPVAEARPALVPLKRSSGGCGTSLPAVRSAL
jgi:hypothetical protein